jgi:hypothetical protein
MSKQRILSLFVFAGSMLLIIPTTSQSQDAWTLRNPMYNGANLYSLTWTGKQLVALGTSSVVRTSPDGTTWTKRDSMPDNGLAQVVWVGSQLVAVGKGIFTSADGELWTNRTPGTTGIFTSVATSGKQIVAVGKAGTISTSSDGVAWTPCSSGTTRDLYSLIWSGSLFVALAGDSGFSGKILTSADGATWRMLSVGAYWLNSIAWSEKDSSYLAVGLYGCIYKSKDCLNWTRLDKSDPFNPGWRSVIWTGSHYVVFGDSTNGSIIRTSQNGGTWTKGSMDISCKLSSMVWTGSQLVATGNYGVVLVSPDGASWASKGSVASTNLRSVAWTGKLFAAVGYAGTILTSPDGITWTSRNSGTSRDLICVAWTGSKLVAVGNYTESRRVNWNDTYPTVFHYCFALASSDGITWELGQDGMNGFLSSMTWNGSTLLAVGPAGNVAASKDGMAWTKGSGVTSDLLGIAWGDSQFVAVGGYTDLTPHDAAYYSLDGITWTRASINLWASILTLYTACWTGSSFVAAGSDGTIITSSDGKSWTGTSGINAGSIYSVSWTGGRVVMLSGGGGISTSLDGKTWASWNSVVSENLNSSASDGKQLVVVGDHGTILTSPIINNAAIPMPVSKVPLPHFSMGKAVNGNLVIQVNGVGNGTGATIRIFDVAGKCLLQTAQRISASRICLPIQGLAAGRYFMQTEVEETRARQSNWFVKAQ